MFALFVIVAAHAGPSTWSVLPDDGLFTLPVADTRSPLSSITVRPESLLDASIAGELHAVGWRNGSIRLQLGVAGAAFMGFRAEGATTYALRTFDGYFGFPIEAAWGAWRARLQWSHVSAHTADGIRGERLELAQDGYSRESAILQLGRHVGPAWLYSGAHWAFHSVSDAPPWTVQVGGQVAAPWVVSPYAAADLKLQQEYDWRPTVAGQLGAWITGGRFRFRVGFAGYLGLEDTGKLAGVEERYVGIVFGFDGTGAVGQPEEEGAALEIVAGADRVPASHQAEGPPL